VPAYIRPLFCEGIGPFRWVALSGDPEDIYRTDRKVKELMPGDAHLHRWLDMARERIKFQGLPARICWVGLKDRARLGLAFNEMVAKGELSAPIVIGRDHLDSGSVASPNRETEAMKDGSDAVSDWAFLNALRALAGPVERLAQASTERPAVAPQPPTLRDHFEHLKGWIVGAYYSSEIGMRELGWTGNVFYAGFPGCPHPGGHR